MVYRKQMEKRNVRLSREGVGTTKVFLDAKGNVIPGSTKSSRNRSSRNDSWYFAVHAKLGSLPIEAILKPVIELAEKGVIVTQKQEERLNHYHDELNKTNGPNSVLSKVYKKRYH
jgi:gamma-glutamyltranspeptidase/glutathione hydrolase